MKLLEKLKCYTSKYHHQGYCDICEKEVVFFIAKEWLRDNYFCTSCMSVPRQRALIKAIKETVPNFKDLEVHESSPCGVSSDSLMRGVSKYTYSHYYPDLSSGDVKDGMICQNLEKMSFNDSSFDLFITQDVFEHLLHPEKALREIRRVLKKDSYHIFTFPWYYWKRTQQRAKLEGDDIVNILPPIFHGNPVDSKGSLVTYDWGYDVIDFIDQFGFETTVFKKNSKGFGLNGEFLEVFISKTI